MIVLILAILVLAGGGWWWWTHRQPVAPHSANTPGRFAQGAPQPVGFATIDKGDIRIVLNELGTVTSLDTVTVYTQISGQLQEVGFKEGQPVHKGDLLYVSVGQNTGSPLNLEGSQNQVHFAAAYVGP